MSTSMVVSGFSRLISRIVCTQCAAPKSGRSSRSTEVMTACDSFIRDMDSATWVGSAGSSGRGTPVAVLQNLQQRVQMSPPIMKVAVPLPQHSLMLGQRPLLQIVCRQCESTMRFVSVYRSLAPMLTLSHSGLRTLMILDDSWSASADYRFFSKKLVSFV